MRNKQLFLLSSLIAVGLAMNSTAEARDLRVRNNIKPINTSLSSSSTGKDVINIVDKNSSGISHNKFDEFDINGDLILNNSITGGNSQLGGYVEGNTNLSGLASTIIAEVTGNKSSSLAGNLEVFGGKSDVIIANQNGIVVNGLSAYNTGNLTLTTGEISGSTNRIGVSKGKLAIEGEGVKNIDGSSINLVAELVAINGHVGTGSEQINVASGSNRVQLESNGNLKITATKGSKNGGITGNNLGSMHGSSIVLMDTSYDGINFRGKMDATTIDIQSNQNIKLGGQMAGTTITVGGKNLDITAKSIGTIVTYRAAEDLTSSSIEGTIVSLSGNKIKLTGRVSGQDLQVNSNEYLENTASLDMKGNVILSSNGTIYNKGVLNTSGELIDIKGKDFYNVGSIQAKNGKLKTTLSNGFYNTKGLNKGSVEVNSADINAENIIVNDDGLFLTYNGDNTFTTKDFYNTGTMLFSGQNQTTFNTTNKFVNQNLITGNKIIINAKEYVTNNKITANELIYNNITE